MKYYVRIFVVSLVIFVGVFLAGWNIFVDSKEVDNSIIATPEFVPTVTLPGDKKIKNKDTSVKVVETSKNELELLVEKSKRLNFLVFAHDGSRADTIMFVSFDPDSKDLDIINIPRDTFWLVEGFTKRADHKKINSVYGHKGDKGGSKGLKQEISNMLKVPVHYYVKFDYDGAAGIIDTIGGVEINVPFDMDYDDVWAKPELHIHLKEGKQLLDGKNAVDYLRWRKNNDDVKSDGDLPRISRMQNFFKTAVKKSINLKLPSVVSAGMKSVRTDIELGIALKYAQYAVDMNSSNISTYRLPGKAPQGSYYYIGDSEAIEELLIDIYSSDRNGE